MKVFVQGKTTSVELTDKHFLTEGGEGKIYILGDTVYKIYSDPAKMISPSKIDELKILDKDNILRPCDVLFDEKKRPVGFTMLYVRDSAALCKLFTTDFQQRFSVTADMISKLVERMAQDIGYIHTKNVLMVDGNEMNYLVDAKTFTLPYFIDVDSWKTPSFPPTAIMPSIRDHHTAGFSELTDWFAFAVVITQLFVGMHPYRGVHPGFKKADMEGRMKANVSIFNHDVRLPSACRSLDAIPKNYKEWLIKVLEKGERLAPPMSAGAVVAVMKAATIHASVQFILDLVLDLNTDIIRFNEGYVTTKDQIISKGRVPGTWNISTPSTEVVHAVVSETPVAVWVDKGVLQLRNLNAIGQRVGTYEFAAEDKMIVGSSIFLKHGDMLTEIAIHQLGPNLQPIVRSSRKVLPHATRLFNGLVYQNVLGKPWVQIPFFMQNGKTAFFESHIKELEGYNILEAKHDNHVAIIVAQTQQGRYDSFILKFSDNFTNYSCTVEEDVSYHVPNFVVLDNGITVRVTDEDAIQIFSNRMDNPKVQEMRDPSITFDMKLCKELSRVMIRKGGKLFRFTMKK